MYVPVPASGLPNNLLPAAVPVLPRAELGAALLPGAGDDVSPMRVLGAGDRDKIPRLQDALRSLLDRGCIGIKRTNDDRVNEVFLNLGEARVVVNDAASWTAPYDPGFDGSGDYFVAVPTDAAERVFQAAVDEGHALLEFESIALT